MEVAVMTHNKLTSCKRSRRLSVGDMTRIASITLLLAALSLSSSGCAHRPNTDTSSSQSFEQMRAETERAFELERRADVVIDYERSDCIRLWTPGQTAHISATDKTLATAIASATSKRELALVIIGKPVRHEFPEPELRAKVDKIEALIRAQGFSRVAFQLASAGAQLFPLDVRCHSLRSTKTTLL